MSERGQKIFKIVVWIAIVLGSIFAIYFKIDSMRNPSITQSEWKNKLAESFGDEQLRLLDETDGYATGEYVAQTCMRALGEKRVSYIAGKDDLTNEELLDLAVDLDIVSEGDLEKKLSETEADQLIVKALDVYFNPEYYPEYCEVETLVDMVDLDEDEIVSYDEEREELVIELDEEPEVGQVLTYTDEYGIMKARTVTSVSSEESGIYDLKLEEIQDISQVITSLSFSGASDFSYLTKNGESEQEPDEMMHTNTLAFAPYFNNHPFLFMANMSPLQVAEWEGFENKTALKQEKTNDSETCDMEFHAEIRFIEKNGEKSTQIVTYVKITSNGLSTLYKCESDGAGKMNFSESVEAENLEFKFSENDFEKLSENTGYMKDEKGFVFDVKLEDFAVCTSGYYQWADPADKKNYVEVLASAEQINISSDFNIKAEDKYKIASIPIPIAATAGMVSIKLNLYVVVSAEGELTFWYEIDNPYAGLNVSIMDGVKPLHGHSGTDAGLRAKIELGCGVVGEAAIMVLDTVDLADPGVDMMFYASASTLDVENGYERKEEYRNIPCLELSAQGPTASITATAGQDSLLYELLDTLKVDATYTLIEKDSTPWKVIYHTESDANGNITCVALEDDQLHTDVCTHIQLKKPKVDKDGNIVDHIGNQIEDEIEKKKQEAEEKFRKEIEKAIEDALEKFILENCGEC